MVLIFRRLYKPRAKEAADKILETWARQSLDELLTYVYNLVEVKEAWPGKPLLR